MHSQKEIVGRTVSKQRIGALLVALFYLLLPGDVSAGIIAKSYVNFFGGGVVDSYDSRDPNRSTNGQYDSAKALTNGFVYCNGPVWLNGTMAVKGRVYNDGQFAFPSIVAPSYAGLMPSSGSVVNVVGTNVNVTSIVTNSLTPPPSPSTNQTIVTTTNTTIVTTTVYPGSQPGLTTNYTVVITGTNRVVTAISTNYVCGTITYSANSLPANVCSYTMQGSGGGPISYKYTLIVGTNMSYATNLVYIYGTNTTYRFNQLYYTYVIYSSTLTYQTNYYDHILCGDAYIGGSLSGLTLVTCPSRLTLTNGFQMTGGDQITIAPGASLELHVGGGNCTLQASGILNNDKLPGSFVVYCANDVTNIEVDGSAMFSGVILAPNSQAAINPNGSLPLNFSGLFMTKSLVVNGNLNFHYDEALERYVHPPYASLATISNGAFCLKVTGASGINCVVQASTNLIDWVSVATNSGLFLMVDTNTAASDRKFYRVLWK